MKCPEYIRYALQQRAKAADRFIHYDTIISDYVQKHDIDAEEYDYGTGCESLCNPWPSAYRILQAIEAKEK